MAANSRHRFHGEGRVWDSRLSRGIFSTTWMPVVNAKDMPLVSLFAFMVARWTTRWRIEHFLKYYVRMSRRRLFFFFFFFSKTCWRGEFAIFITAEYRNTALYVYLFIERLQNEFIVHVRSCMRSLSPHNIVQFGNYVRYFVIVLYQP